jgi:hypothetical protein
VCARGKCDAFYRRGQAEQGAHCFVVKQPRERGGGTRPLAARVDRDRRAVRQTTGDGRAWAFHTAGHELQGKLLGRRAAKRARWSWDARPTWGWGGGGGRRGDMGATWRCAWVRSGARCGTR